VRWSLADHARQPNETNLDIHYVLPEEGLWTVCERARDDPSQDICVQPRASTSELPPAVEEASGPRQLVNNTSATPDNFLALSATPKPPSVPSTTVQPTPASTLLYKLRWANIGWVPQFPCSLLFILMFWVTVLSLGYKTVRFHQRKGQDRRGACRCLSECGELCRLEPGIRPFRHVRLGRIWTRVENMEQRLWYSSIFLREVRLNPAAEPDAGIVNFYQTKVGDCTDLFNTN
jgi:hypothetical protein